MGHEHTHTAAPTRNGIEAQLDAAAAACAEKGAQLTELRRAVLGLALAAGGPVTAYQLLDQLKEIRKGAVPPTVYRALDFLREHGLVHKVERLNAYIPCVDAEHAHAAQFLICRRCGAVAEIEDGPVTLALERAAEKQGFKTDSAVVELAGVCADCAKAA